MRAIIKSKPVSIIAVSDSYCRFPLILFVSVDECVTDSIIGVAGLPTLVFNMNKKLGAENITKIRVYNPNVIINDFHRYFFVA